MFDFLLNFLVNYYFTLIVCCIGSAVFGSAVTVLFDERRMRRAARRSIEQVDAEATARRLLESCEFLGKDS